MCLPGVGTSAQILPPTTAVSVLTLTPAAPSRRLHRPAVSGRCGFDCGRLEEAAAAGFCVTAVLERLVSGHHRENVSIMSTMSQLKGLFVFVF